MLCIWKAACEVTVLSSTFSNNSTGKALLIDITPYVQVLSRMFSKPMSFASLKALGHYTQMLPMFIKVYLK